MNLKNNIIIDLKYQFIFSIIVAIILGFLFSLFKNDIGYDERLYLINGEFLLNDGFHNVKNLPFISLLFYLSVLPFENELVGLRVLYALSLTLISIFQFYFAYQLGEKKNPIISSLIVLIIPGLAVLNLYSLANLVSTSLLMFGLFLVCLYIKYNKLLLIFVIGIFFSLLYQSRAEFLFIFLILILSWPLLIDYKNKKYRFLLRDLSILISTFILILFPWQYFLYKNDLYFISTASGRGWRSVYHYVFSEDLFSNFIINLKDIIIILIKNSFEHLKNLGSPKLFPIFFLPLVGIGFLQLTKSRILFIFMTPLVIFFPLCGYYHPDFNLTRMFTPMLPILSMCLSVFVTSTNKNNKNYLKIKFFSVFIVLFLYTLSFFIFGNTTYK